MTVRGFFGSNLFLSNFYICPDGVEMDRVLYHTAEHAYQAAKTPGATGCRSPLVLRREDAVDGKRFSTVDHKMPLGAGGIDNANNRVLACEECNQERGDRPGAPEMYVEQGSV